MLHVCSARARLQGFRLESVLLHYVWLTGADIVYFVGGCISDKCAFFSFSACATDVPFSNVETLLPGVCVNDVHFIANAVTVYNVQFSVSH